MRKTFIILLIFGAMPMLFSATTSSQKNVYLNNREPLQPKPFIELPLGNIQAEGWLKDQLVRMKDGMTGHLDSIYNEVMESLKRLVRR